MSSLILHHYPTSPFAEKIRTILGYKKLAWKSVLIPPVMPKPDVTALTGGYRKTPILQIGADIYCDTELIARVLERLQPAPSLYPAEAGSGARLFAQWADTTLFWTSIPFALQPAGIGHVLKDMTPEQMERFAVDRAAFRARLPRMRPAEASAGFKTYLASIEGVLQDGRAWLCGTLPSIADFSVYHCFWFAHRAGPVAEIFESAPHVTRWYAAMKAIGHGTSEPLESGAAVELARTAQPATIDDPHLIDAGDIALGETVTVTPTDTGCDPVAGELLSIDAGETIVQRHDDRAGTVRVHFPRIAFEVRRAT